jgi:SAM-dependent methyltransferase
VTDVFRRMIPLSLRRKLGAAWAEVRRGKVDLGDLRRLSPLSREFGFDRGQPIDRHYIERFLETNAEVIRGDVLEVGTSMYSRRFGGPQVSSVEVLHASEEKPEVTRIGDLTDPDLPIADASFDCVILTQVLQFIFDAPAALRTVHRLLRPGGVLLLTVAGLSPASRYDMDRWGEYWRFTSAAVDRLCHEAFPDCDVEVLAHGNVLTAASFLYGLAADELAAEELDYTDEDFQVIVTARVRKPASIV